MLDMFSGFIDYENKESLREKYKSHLNWYWTKHDKKSIYYPSDYVKFLEKGKINAQEWLEENYPKNGTCRIKEVGKFGKTRKKIKELTIRKKAVEGELDLSDFKNLKGLYCSDNHLTQIIYPANSENITGLSISNNNLLPQDLSVFSQFRNLESLRIGNYNEEKINQNIYNRFTGSLDYLRKNEYGYDREVVLKSLNNSQNITPEFLTEIANNKLVDFFSNGSSYIIKCYGISQDPETKNYVMIMQYMYEDTKFTQQLQASEAHNETLPDAIRFPTYQQHPEIEFKVIHGRQENLSRSICYGCFTKQHSTIKNTSFPPFIYLMIVKLDSFGNEMTNAYCSKCAIEFYDQKADELAGQEKVQEMRKDRVSNNL
ncbi:14630_t:CDS:2 [Gigaspora margarita]|uniref:14630_t:CDS:1 n=1 Tax=Gigaspora margarita TaxID=4874 RepID=A0ABN7V8X3_GIGMA|nr:14630_t:CDS:2 [Gigaspora margarita]